MANNGLGFPVSLVLAEVEKIERILTLLPDFPVTYPDGSASSVKHGVQGAKVHDTRLIAAMNAHGVGRLLTFNRGDFTRYGIEILDRPVIGV